MKRPDGDNLEKYLNDSLNGLLWFDDSQIVWHVRSKLITSEKNGSTTIFVSELPTGKTDYPELMKIISENINFEKDKQEIIDFDELNSFDKINHPINNE